MAGDSAGRAAAESFDAEVIDSAADRQMAHVRTFQTGPRSATSAGSLDIRTKLSIKRRDGYSR